MPEININQKRLIQIYKEKKHELSKRSNSHYMFVCNDENNTINSKNINDICYARLMRGGYDEEYTGNGILECIVPVDQHTRWEKGTEEYKAVKLFMNWVIKSSPWKNAFIQHLSKWEKNGYVIVNTEETHTYVVGALSVLRESWEYIASTVRWYRFVTEHKIDKTLAHVITNTMTDEEDYDRFMANVGGKGGHGGITTKHMTEKEIVSYVCGKMNRGKSLGDIKPMTVYSKSYSGIFKLTSDGNLDTFLENELFKKLEIVTTGVGWNKRNFIFLDKNNMKKIRAFCREIMKDVNKSKEKEDV